VLVSPCSDAIAHGILSVLDDPTLAERLSTAARHYARTHLGWSRFVHSVDALYAEVERHANVTGS